MAADVVDGALLGRAHPMLDLGEGLFDRIEVGRVWRQIPEPCAGSFNEGAQRSRLVTAEVVHNDDVAWLKLRDENLLNIGAEAFSVDWTIEQARCGEAVPTQGAEESQCPPMAVWREAPQPLAFWSPSAQWGHVGLDPGFVDEDKAARVDPVAIMDPSPAPSCDVRADLFGGQNGFF